MKAGGSLFWPRTSFSNANQRILFFYIQHGSNLLVCPTVRGYLVRSNEEWLVKVIIPVAGEGTRLRPHTYTLPKPLLSVAGKPILAHVIDPFVELQPEEVILVVGSRGEMIREYVQNRYRFKSTFVRQDKILGLGYALNMALGEVSDGPVLIILGDTIVDCDLKRFVAAGDVVLGLRQVDDPSRFGIAELDGNRIARLEEKPEHPKTNLAVIGLYYFGDVVQLKSYLNEHVSSGKTTRGEIQFTDAIQRMISGGTDIRPFEVQNWFDCGKKSTMLESNRHLLAGQPAPTPVEGSALVPPVFIDDSVILEGSVVGPNVSVSEGTAIRHSIVTNSIIGSQSVVENAIVDNSIVGRGVVVKGKAANLNLGDSSEYCIS